MKLTSPATARHRFDVRCFKNGKLLHQFASSASGRHDFEVNDDADAVLYSVGDQSWVWVDDQWLNRKAGESKLHPPKIDEAAWANAVAYTAEFDKREKVVKKAFKQVTKTL